MISGIFAIGECLCVLGVLSGLTWRVSTSVMPCHAERFLEAEEVKGISRRLGGKGRGFGVTKKTTLCYIAASEKLMIS